MAYLLNDVGHELNSQALLIRFSKLLWSSYVADADCLLDGSAGPITDMSALPCVLDAITQEGPWRQALAANSHMKGLQFVAFNSKTKSFIVQLQPVIKIIYRWSYPALSDADMSADSFQATMDWSYGSPVPASSTVPLPQLARVCNGENVQILSLSFSEHDNAVGFNVTTERCFTGYHFLSIKWLSHGSSLALLSSSEIIIVKPSLEIVESAILLPSLTVELQPILGTPQSPPTSASPINSILCVHDSNFYFLCPTALYFYHQQNWVEQVDQLIKDGRWLEALSVALDSWSKRISEDASDSKDKAYLEKYIKKYVDLALAPHSTPSSKSQAHHNSRNHFSMVAGVCIEYCVSCGREDLLFGELFDVFVGCRQDEVFLESLEPFILSGKVKSLPQRVISSFLDAKERTRRFSALERCVVHLDLADNVVEPILLFLRRHKLYSGYLYAHVTVQQDLSGALLAIFQDMLELGPVDQFPSSEQAAAGYKLLLFLWSYSESRVFPLDHTCVVDPAKLLQLVQMCFTHDSKLAVDNEDLKYSILYFLSKVDSRAVVFCVSQLLKALQAKAKGDLGIGSTTVESFYSMFFNFVKATDLLQRSTEGEKYLFEICLDQLVDCSMALSPTILDALIVYSASYVAPRSRAEDLMTKLASRQCKHAQLSSPLRQSLCGNGFWIAALSVQNRKLGGTGYSTDDFVAGIDSYLRLQSHSARAGDGKDVTLVFDYIDAQFAGLQSDGVSDSVLAGYCSALCCALPELAAASPERTQVITCRYLSNCTAEVCEATKKHTRTQFTLLHALMKAVREDPSKEFTEVFTQADVVVFIKLLLTFRAKDVYTFVSRIDHYPLDEVLALCKEKDSALDATAYLLERAGDASGALDLLLCDLGKVIVAARKEMEQQLKVDSIQARSASSGSHSSSESRSLASQILSKQGPARAEAAVKLACMKDLQHVASCCANLCGRHSSKADPKMWFSAFDYLLRERQNIRQGFHSS